MREIQVQKSIEAPKSAVWAVLADFPNISKWNGGVAASFATSEATGGVGATRHCDLSPAGELEETIVEWTPESKLVVSIDSAKKLPLQSGLATFTLDDSGGENCTTAINYRYQTKWGLLGSLMGPLMDGQLRKGFKGFLDDLEAEAVKQTA